jgi:hypothetical protein
VRIPSLLDEFLDRHGVLDAGYEALAAAGNVVSVLRGDRTVTPWAGRCLVVVDSGVRARPAWSAAPRRDLRAKMPDTVDTAY